MRTLILISIILTATLAQAGGYEELRSRFGTARQLDLNALPEDTVSTHRGSCYYIQSTEEAPDPKAAVMVVKTTTYPANGPVLPQRKTFAYITDGYKTDQVAIDDFEASLNLKDSYGFLRDDSSYTYRSWGKFALAVSFVGCDPSGKNRYQCNHGYIRQDDYFFVSIGKRRQPDPNFPSPHGKAWEYSDYQFCFFR